MNGTFKKLAKEIKFEISKSFNTTRVLKAKLVKNYIFELLFENREIIPFNEMEQFLICLNQNFKYKTQFNFVITSIVYDEVELKKYINWIVKDFLKKPHLSKIIMDAEIVINSSKVDVKINTQHALNQVNTIKEDLTRIIAKMGYNNIDLSFIYSKSATEILSNEKEINLKAASAVALKRSEVPVKKEVYEPAKHNGYQKMSIKELATTHAKNIIIDAEIFDIKETTTKTGLVIFQYSVTDYEDAIYTKVFARSDKDIEKARGYKKGDFLSIYGQYQIDAFSKEPTILVRKIIPAENSLSDREDNSSSKRVELHARTRMSTMDGIVTAKELVSRAKKWGHKAITLVDTDSVQSFPEFYHASKGSGVKPIFGSTFSVIDKNPKAIVNPLSKELANDSYIVFDIETTGLSPIFNEIIEFGAVKVKQGSFVEKKQFFIKPTSKISKFTTELTGITDQHVETAKSEREAIKDIYDFLKGYTLVAHNANFDITFVNEKLEEYGYETLNEPVIDSMVVGRIIHPESKRFRLENMATRLNVSYDSTVAHRADYDAEVLARVWIKSIHILSEMNILNHNDLFNYSNKTLLSKSFANEVSIIAKNQDGLKELFKLSSFSLTDNYMRGPRLFMEDLNDRENILLGSGSLKSRLVDRMFFGSKKQIKEEIKKYDYIEVQPLKNFAHIINRGTSESDVKKILSFVIHEAKKIGKIVVATGDVRYLDEKDKLYHNVYINAKGLGGSRHHLFRFKEEDPVYPIQHMLTTQEMIDAFVFLEDIRLIKEIVITNTNKIADLIEEIEVIKKDLYTPKFGDSDKDLSDFVYKTSREIYGDKLPEIVEKRLKRELEPITKYGFAVIYWISHLLVAKSLDDGYLVGSRGSVGSSLVATMSRITEVNPLPPHYLCSNCKYSEFFENSKLNSGYDLPSKKCPNCSEELRKEGQNIPFETFLGFDADKVPDIDLNFSGDYQPTIHNEVKELFGDKHAFRAGTISTVAEKTAFGYVKSWAEENNKMLSKPFTEYVAKGVTGTKRTSGQHPGGIIVIPKEFDVEDFTPINFPANDINAAWKTTHFDFHAIHDNVLKLDLLGHDDPTAIRLLEKLTGVKATDIPFSDDKIISLFSSTEALNITPNDILGEPTGAMGIPEFGTKFVRGMLKNAKVTSFGDLISVSGLSHGTDVWANNAESLVKAGKTLSEVISCRDNIMVDLMNKGLDPLMSFNIMESVRKGKGLTDHWKKELKKHNVEEWYVDSLEKIKYMFPKAHATAYVMMAWRIAWFKLYHPAAYYATYFTTRADVFDIATVNAGKTQIEKKLQDWKSRRFVRGENALTNKEVSLIPILEIANEALARGVKIKNIDIEKSLAKEWIIEGNSLIPPFSTIDGLGDSVADSIILARNKAKFVSKEDLQKRTSVNKTTLQKFEDLGILKNLSQSNQFELDFGF